MKSQIAPELFEAEIRFTQAYKENINKSPAIREALCLRERLAVLAPIDTEELFAGGIKEGLFGFALEEASGGAGGYGFYPDAAQKEEDIRNANINSALKEQILEAAAFWHENSVCALVQKAAPEIQYVLYKGIASGITRLSGVYLDYDKLLTVGLPGLIAEAEERKQNAEGETLNFYEGVIMALNFLVQICETYAEQAEKINQPEMAETLLCITRRPPQTLREAIQLFYLYALMSGVVNYGRLDVFLGDFYARDIDEGRLKEDEALGFIMSLWRIIAKRNIVFNGRVIIGGVGRRNEANADRFAMAAMEASRRVVETEPQLTLRFHKDQNPSLMKKALDVIGEGRVYPMLYNDDVNVPAVRSAFQIPQPEAEQYLPYGCGEYAIDHMSLSSPNCTLNTLKALEAVLHNGHDGQTGEALGYAAGEPESFKTFEDLMSAYKKQVECYAEVLAVRHVREYEVERKQAAYLLASVLFDCSMEKGRSMVDGGARYLGGICESFGNTNTGDSLAVIKKLVFENKVWTLRQLVEMLDADFNGYEKERKMMLDIPKYGNDDEETDALVTEVNAHIGKTCMEAGKKAGLHHFLVVNINNESNVIYGYGTAASADGRKSGTPLANGNTPTAGMDKNGPTAFLNSIVKIDPKLHAGYVHNMKFSKRMFNEKRGITESLLNVYFENGGTQAMINVLDKSDLERAVTEPEQYQNLIVRVGGFCARFVTLSKDLQQDIINRTLY